MSPSPPSPPVLDQVVAQLSQELGVNLYSCCLYGSAVRGNAIAGVSDLNILIVLGESNAAAHAAVARALEKFPDVDPFVLGRRGFERSMRAFAPKFASIRRNYRVLAGADPLAGFQVDAPLERFLCEQSLRNLRLRLAYSFITRKRHEAYDRYLRRQVTPIFLAHGTMDPVVPLQAGQMSRDALRALGYDVEWHDYPMQHSVCMEEVQDLNRWLLKALA